jgi:hypothetical protein
MRTKKIWLWKYWIHLQTTFKNTARSRAKFRWKRWTSNGKVSGAPHLNLLIKHSLPRQTRFKDWLGHSHRDPRRDRQHSAKLSATKKRSQTRRFLSCTCFIMNGRANHLTCYSASTKTRLHSRLRAQKFSSYRSTYKISRGQTPTYASTRGRCHRTESPKLKSWYGTIYGRRV